MRNLLFMFFIIKPIDIKAHISDRKSNMKSLTPPFFSTDPTFVHAHLIPDSAEKNDDKLYFFFREKASEMGQSPMTQSRIGRICLVSYRSSQQASRWSRQLKGSDVSVMVTACRLFPNALREAHKGSSPAIASKRCAQEFNANQSQTSACAVCFHSLVWKEFRYFCFAGWCTSVCTHTRAYKPWTVFTLHSSVVFHSRRTNDGQSLKLPNNPRGHRERGACACPLPVWIMLKFVQIMLKPTNQPP